MQSRLAGANRLFPVGQEINRFLRIVNKEKRWNRCLGDQFAGGDIQLFRSKWLTPDLWGFQF